MTMLELPEMGFIRPRDPTSISGTEAFPRLPDDWRERLSKPIMEAEAQRRINDVFPPSEQLAALNEAMDLVIQHGTDASQWPQDAKDRKAVLDEKWNYVREVEARAKQTLTVPFNPTIDKNWPTRIKK